MNRWSDRSGIAVQRFIDWLGVRSSKFYNWKQRYGRVNEHNGKIPRDFWLEEWEFAESSSQTREVLPHPSVQLVFARGRSRIYGVQLGRFVRQLSGKDRILGIKFRPGAFYPFLRQPVCSITSRSIPAAQIFPDVEGATERVLSNRSDLGMV